MNINKKSINSFDYYEVRLEKHKKNYFNDLLDEATELANSVDKRDPSGNYRSLDLRISKALGGIFAEKSVKKLIRTLSNNKIRLYRDTRPDSALEQKDIIIEFNSRKKVIEVRSSFSYKTSFQRVFNGAFSLVGPYTTEAKSREIKKDAYIFCFYHGFLPSKIQEEFSKKGLSCFVAAGATKSYLEQNGKISNMDQDGASYLNIKPINKAQEVNLVIKNVLKEM